MKKIFTSVLSLICATCYAQSILGLGLGNEGLHEAADKDATYAQWKNNIQKLVAQMQAEGKKPVVTNNYPRGDYNATDYAYAKKMNLEMHEWDIPTVNFLGALDNCKGNGQWADGYQVSGDIYHPTTEGHVEFMHAFVPSLFDALAQGKALLARQSVSDGLMLTSKKQLVVVPEDQAHSFTLAVNLKASAVSSSVSLSISAMMSCAR